MKAQASLHISSASQEHLLLDDNLPKIVSYPPGRINIVRFFLEDPSFNVSFFSHPAQQTGGGGNNALHYVGYNANLSEGK